MNAVSRRREEVADVAALPRRLHRARVEARPDPRRRLPGGHAPELRDARQRRAGAADAAAAGDLDAGPGRRAGVRLDQRRARVVLTTFELDEYVFGALRAGASGFLLKDIEPVDLLTAVRVVAEGEALLAPRLTRRLIEAFVAQERATPPAPADDARLAELTPREREVLALVGRGLSNAEIADALVLSPLTAKTHVARLFAKLDARDRAQLVVVAYESGLVVAGER